jgi:hypothetical protein
MVKFSSNFAAGVSEGGVTIYVDCYIATLLLELRFLATPLFLYEQCTGKDNLRVQRNLFQVEEPLVSSLQICQ